MVFVVCDKGVDDGACNKKQHEIEESKYSSDGSQHGGSPFLGGAGLVDGQVVENAVGRVAGGAGGE